jgi:hypothetical protein
MSAPKQRSWFNQLVSGLSNSYNQATNQPNNQYSKQRGSSYSQYAQNGQMSQNGRNYDASQRYQNGQNVQNHGQNVPNYAQNLSQNLGQTHSKTPQSQQYAHQSNQYLQHSTRNEGNQTGHVTQHSTQNAEPQPNQPQNSGNPACQTTVDVEKVTIQFDDRSFSTIKASLMTSLLSLNQITHTMTRPNHFLCEYKSSRQTASVFSKTTKFSIEIVEKGGLDIYVYFILVNGNSNRFRKLVQYLYERIVANSVPVVRPVQVKPTLIENQIKNSEQNHQTSQNRQAPSARQTPPNHQPNVAKPPIVPKKTSGKHRMEPLATGVVNSAGSRDKIVKQGSQNSLQANRMVPSANSPVSVGSSSQVSSTSHSTTNSQSNSSMSSGLGASTQSIVSNKHHKNQQSHSDQTQASNSSPKVSQQVQSTKSADSVNNKSQVPNLNQAKPMRSGSGSSSGRNSGQRSQIYNQISEFSKEMEQLNKSAANLQVHELMRDNSK